MSDTTNTPTLSQNEALEMMGRFLNVANKRGAFDLLEAEQVIRAISVFRVMPRAPTPVPTPAADTPAPTDAPVATPNITTI